MSSIPASVIKQTVNMGDLPYFDQKKEIFQFLIGIVHFLIQIEVDKDDYC